MTGLTVGIIGLGAMGEAIGRRLLRAGYPLMVFDISSGPLRYFVMKHQGGDVAMSPRVMAECCDVIITVLPSVEAARSAVFGADGVAHLNQTGGGKPGRILIEMGHAAVTEERMAELAERGLTVLEAPMCGTPVDAKNGRLVIPVAGDAAAVERVMPVLTTLGEKVVATGPIGSGAVMAALAGALRAVGVLAAAELLQLGERHGVAPAALLEFCAGQGAVGAAVVEALRPRDTPTSLAATHTIGAVQQDLEATVTLAQQDGMPLRQTELAREIWGAVARDRGADDDHATVARWLAAQAKPPPDGDPAS